jgi:hypothetical protein
MPSAPKTDILTDCLWPTVGNDPLITLMRAKATPEAATPVSVSEQLVYVVLKALGYSRTRMYSFTHFHLPPKSQ